jgi:CheY-like chemotaxis protein
MGAVMERNVLLVDDEKDIVTVLKIALEKEGYKVVEAFDGMEALEKVKKAKFDVIILDIMMPKLDGHSVNLKLKESPKTSEIPVVVITGRGHMKELLEIREELKVAEYLEKPFAVSFLVKRIKEIAPFS